MIRHITNDLDFFFFLMILMRNKFKLAIFLQKQIFGCKKISEAKN